MLTSIQLEHPDVIRQLRIDYLRTLVAPMDGMWESANIAHATFWEIQDQERRIGHFCIDSNNYLLRVHLLEQYKACSQEIFRWIISTYGIQFAITSTIEPLYFSLCLDMQENVKVLTYLFRDNAQLEPSLTTSGFKKAEKRTLDEITNFYRANTEGNGDWIEAFLQERLKREELFVIYEQQTLVATGECIPSEKQTPFADLGMVVAQSCRGRGLGSSMLIRLKKHCYEMGWKPICSCTADNLASKKAIEKAGFVSEHRMVEITLSIVRRLIADEFACHVPLVRDQSSDYR